MHPNYKENMLVVMLNDVSGRILPRLFSLRAKLEKGELLTEQEVSLLARYLDRIKQCALFYTNDEQCRIIFSSTVHLLLRVISIALENEQTELKAA